MADRKPLISGNWKMHHNHFEAIQLVQKLGYLIDKSDYEAVDVSVHPPFTDLRSVQTVIESDKLPIQLGAQNCHPEEKGAFTGEVSPPMLAKLNVSLVIVGHSERRELFGETDEFVNQKVKAVFKHEMTPILCCGETLEEREAGHAESKVENQIRQGLAGVKRDQVAVDGHRLRADLGHRHRQDGHRRRRPGDVRPRPWRGGATPPATMPPRRSGSSTAAR